MALILEPTEAMFKSVRTLLGGVDEISLPDEDIADPVMIDMAEIEVAGLLPNFQDFAEDPEKARIRLAAIYFLASLLCPTMPARVEIEVKSIDTSWKKKAVNYTDLAEELASKAVNLLLPLGAGSMDAGVFRIAPSKRAVGERWGN